MTHDINWIEPDNQLLAYHTQHHREIQIEWMSKNMNEYNQIN